MLASNASPWVQDVLCQFDSQLVHHLILLSCVEVVEFMLLNRIELASRMMVEQPMPPAFLMKYGLVMFLHDQRSVNDGMVLGI